MNRINGIPQPDWYPSEISEADDTWTLFCHNQSGLNAMRAIIGISKSNLPIPDALLPWLEKACVAWLNAEGNKREISNQLTKEKWRTAVHDVWMKHQTGMILDGAINEVAESIFVSQGTMKKEYSKSWAIKMRKDREASLQRQYDQALQEKDDATIELLKAVFPRMFAN